MNLNIFNFKLKMTSKKVKKVMPDFDKIQVSTHTVIAKTNSTYDTQRLFHFSSCFPYFLKWRIMCAVVIKLIYLFVCDD